MQCRCVDADDSRTRLRCSTRARFRFKQDEVASVKSYEIRIGGRHVKAEVHEKEVAHDTYDDAIAQGQRAFTLEQGTIRHTLSLLSLIPL